MEAAALEKPLLLGPRMSNFREISADLIAQGAAREVADDAALEREVVRLLRDSGQRDAMAAAAGSWHRSNAGAVKRTIAIIREELTKIDCSEGRLAV